MNEHLHLAAQLQNDVERESLRKEEWVWVEVEEGAEDGGVGPTRAAASALGNLNWNWNWKGDKIQLFVSEIIFAWKNGSQGHHFGKILNSKFRKGLGHSAMVNYPVQFWTVQINTEPCGSCFEVLTILTIQMNFGTTFANSILLLSVTLKIGSWKIFWKAVVGMINGG